MWYSVVYNFTLKISLILWGLKIECFRMCLHTHTHILLRTDLSNNLENVSVECGLQSPTIKEIMLLTAVLYKGSMMVLITKEELT